MLTESTERAPSPLPIWLSIPIILLCLGCGGWIIHWYVMTDPISHESKVLGDSAAVVPFQGGGARVRQNGVPAGAGGAARNRTVVPRRHVVVNPNGNVDVSTEKARAIVNVAKGKANIRNITYTNYPALPDDAKKTMDAAANLEQNQKITEALKLDVHQISRLRALSLNPPMALSASDRQAFATAVANYVADEKNRPALETTLMQQLDDISDRSIAATQQAAAVQASQINQIVTPDMWKQSAAMGGK